MEIYLFKSAACLAIFYIFYKLFLERESFHNFKRIYLIASVIGAFLIPFITFTQYIEPQQIVSTNLFTQEFSSITSSGAEIATNYLPAFMWSLYGLGVLFFSIKFFRNLFNLIRKIRTNPLYESAGFFHVLLNTSVTPHTFFSYIFLNKRKFEANEIPSEVLIHEHAHAAQKHSLDIMFIELLQIVFWFNPIIYLLKRSIKLNHEFLADRVVLRSGANTSHYQEILLAFSSNALVPQMANSINYSSIRKRFTVMKTHTSRRTLVLRTFIIIPLLALLIYGFSTTQIVEKPVEASKIEHATPQQLVKYQKMASHWNSYFEENPDDRTMPLTELKELENIYRIMSPLQKENSAPFPAGFTSKEELLKAQAQATTKEIAEYNALAKKYNTMAKDNMFVQKKDIERLKYIYGKMSPKQRADAEPFPQLPPPPPSAPDAPKIIEGVNDNKPNRPPPPPAPDNMGQNSMPANPPPPPPAPESPIDHLVSMAKNGASFYYEGKKINSDKAIALLKKNNNLNIETTKVNSSNPQVKITKAPIRIKKENEPFIMTVVDMPLYGPQPNIDDPKELLNLMINNGADVFFEGKIISKEKAFQLLEKEKSIQIKKIDTPHDKPSVILGSDYGC